MFLKKSEKRRMKTIYYNGIVYTGELPLKQAFIVKDGRFIFVGDTKSARSMAKSGLFFGCISYAKSI